MYSARTPPSGLCREVWCIGKCNIDNTQTVTNTIGFRKLMLPVFFQTLGLRITACILFLKKT